MSAKQNADSQVRTGVMTPDEAIVYYERAAQSEPGNADNFLELGAALYIAHRFDQALEAFEKAVAINPQLGHAHYYLGVLYAAKGMRDKANEALQKVVEVSTNPILRAQAEARIPNVMSPAQLGNQ